MKKLTFFLLFFVFMFTWGNMENNLREVNATIDKSGHDRFNVKIEFCINRYSAGYKALAEKNKGKIHWEAYITTRKNPSENQHYVSCGCVQYDGTVRFSEQCIHTQIHKREIPFLLNHLWIKVYSDFGGVKTEPKWAYAGILIQ